MTLLIKLLILMHFRLCKLKLYFNFFYSTALVFFYDQKDFYLTFYYVQAVVVEEIE